MRKFNLNRLPEEVRMVADRIHNAGGETYLVGGAVIDLVKERIPKDWDLEIRLKSMEQLEVLFGDLSCKTVGRAFGILKITINEVEIDINVPRVDNKVGKGHKDFVCACDPQMSVKEAARRRDFTINTLAVNMATGELHDPFGGLADLHNGVLRATDSKLFAEDPLRAFRAMQLLPRKARVIDPSTMGLIRGMVNDFPHLPKERVYEEWNKLLMKAEKPSIGLEFLWDSGLIKWFPQMKEQEGTLQNLEYHPEGDVKTHMMYTTDSAAEVRDELPEEWRLAFMYGAMCHDFGKVKMSITEEHLRTGIGPKGIKLDPRQDLHSAWGHDTYGVIPGEAFMQLLTNNKKLIENVTTIIREHMQPYFLSTGGAGEGSWKRLHKRVPLNVIGWMSKCDCCGNPIKSIGDPDLEHEYSQNCFNRFDDLGPEPVKAILMGRHLVAAGHKPGPSFKIALDAAYDQQLDNDSLTQEELLVIAVQAL